MADRPQPFCSSGEHPSGLLRSAVDRKIPNPVFEALLRNIQSAFDRTVDILKENSIDVLRTQLHYCASMDMRYIRMMTVHDEVESGRLTVPEEPSRSTAAMWLELK